MSEPYVGEIRMFGGNYAPVGWALCNGQLLSISENEALFALIGTTYGGDGQTNFALPDMSGRLPVHPAANYSLGTKGGVEKVSITSDQLPSHTHSAKASSGPGNVSSPSSSIWAASTSYSDGVSITPVAMNNQLISSVGGNQPHDNMMPSLTVSFIIALVGIFPSQG